jgi:hypothetical protein
VLITKSGPLYATAKPEEPGRSVSDPESQVRNSDQKRRKSTPEKCERFVGVKVFTVQVALRGGSDLSPSSMGAKIGQSPTGPKI